MCCHIMDRYYGNSIIICDAPCFILLAQPSASITTTGKAVHSETFTVTCRASLEAVAAAHLIQYMTVEWVRADGGTIRQEHGDPFVEEQNIVNDSVTRSLFFDPLYMTHGGNYVCRAKLTLPGSAGVFQTEEEYQLNVLSKIETPIVFVLASIPLIPQI